MVRYQPDDPEIRIRRREVTREDQWIIRRNPHTPSDQHRWVAFPRNTAAHVSLFPPRRFVLFPTHQEALAYVLRKVYGR